MADDFIPDDQFHPDAPVAAAAPAPAGSGPGFIPDSQFVPDESKYGTPGQMALTSLEGAAKGFLGPVATGAEKVLSKAGVPGLTPEDQAGRESANPWTHGISELGGFGAGAVTGTGEAALLAKAGEAAVPVAALAGIGGKGAGLLGQIGSHVVRGTVENALFQTGDEVSRYINDPKSVESAIPHVGLAAMIGGVIGGAAGGVSTLWRETLGTKAGSILSAIADRAGGIEGVEANEAEKALAKTAMEIPPEIQAGVTNDPVIREQFAILNQSDTTNSGREFQQTLDKFRDSSGEALAGSLGRTADTIPDEFDKFSHGKNVGLTLADEVEKRIEPLKGAYDEYAHKYAGKELEPNLYDKAESAQREMDSATKTLEKATRAAQRAQAAGDPGLAIESAAKVEEAQAALEAAATRAKTPGTIDRISDKIGQMASSEGWATSPSSDIMKEVNRVLKELPLQKTLKNLSDFIKQMPFDPLDPSFNRAVGMMKGVLRDSEGELIGNHIGSEEGQHVLDAYRATQKTYAAESRIREELQDRLGKLGSTSSYSKSIKEMATTDAESLFRKLSGKDDAAVLGFLKTNFPKTAEALRQAHLDQILSKSKVGDKVDPYKLLKAWRGLSPQLRSFVTPAASSERIHALGWVLDKLKDTHYNYSGTGRTIDKLFQYVPGSAIGIASMLMGHNPALSFMLGALTKYVSKDAPDAIRLGLLKWLGSNKPIDPGAFKSMVDLIHSTIKGEDLSHRAVKAVFSGASKVIPEHLMASPAELDHLDKKIKSMDLNPDHLEKTGHLPSYYMPNHGVSMTGTASNAIGYLNSIRPATIKNSPLDKEIPPSESKKADFNRALEIAQQPLSVLQSMPNGQITSRDVAHLRALYPALYERLNQKFTDEISNHISKGQSFPYALRRGLSTFLGQPMDSTMSPAAIQSNQFVFAQSSQQHAAQESKMMGGQKGSLVGMRELTLANRMKLGVKDDS